jgi:dolichol-phosphate mannosyltransferase
MSGGSKTAVLYLSFMDIENLGASDALWPSIAAMIALALQLPAVALLLSRLIRGPFRRTPLQPESPSPTLLGTVSVVVPTLNEAARIAPCLEGLSRYEVREILVVDSRSQDGTPELVKAAAQSDPRFRVMTDEALPTGWVGRPWALHSGFNNISEHSTWFLGLDADTQPQPGLVASIVKAAIAYDLDLVSSSSSILAKFGSSLPY